MPRSLTQRVQEVQTAATRLRRRYGYARALAATLLAVTGAGLIDYFWRSNQPAARWLLSAMTLAGAVYALVRFVWPVVSRRESLVSTARRIERHFPQLEERLSTAIDFANLSPSDATAGSPQLRSAAIAAAEAAATGLDFQSVLNRHAPQWAFVTLCAAGSLVGLIVAFDWPAASHASARLVAPWRSLPWPRRHELVFESAPQRIASGDSFEVVVTDRRGELPAHVELELHHEAPLGPRRETREMKRVGEQMVYRLENVKSGFAYRARGGDDQSMPWTWLAVVERPRVTELQVRVIPPPYTGLGEQAAGQVAKALAGSLLRLRGRLDQPIRSAQLTADTADVPLPAVAVAEDGRSFTAGVASAWLLERSQTVTLALTDSQGLTYDRATQLDLPVVPDAPPAIAWETPSDKGRFTAQAVVPMRGIVKDDLAVSAVQLRYLLPRHSDEERVVEIFTNTWKPPTSGVPEKLLSLPSATDSVTLDYGWDLREVPALAPGDALTVRITAEDFRPQLATTASRRLTIITLDELARHVAAQQALVLAQVAEALRLERHCRAQTGDLEAHVRGAEQIVAADVNQLVAIQHTQGQVVRLLNDQAEGAAGQIAALLAELSINRAVELPCALQLRELLTAVRTLNHGPAPAVTHDLDEALKSASAANETWPGESPSSCVAGPPQDLAEQLEQALARQDSIIQALETIVGAQTRWESVQRAVGELDHIQDAQRRLLDETTALAGRTMAAAGTSSAADRATALQLGERELDLARQLDKLQARLEETASQGHTDDPRGPAVFHAARAAARRLAIGGQMRDAATRLGQQQLGQAAAAERAVLAALKQLSAALQKQVGHAARQSPSAERPSDHSARDANLPASSELLQLQSQQEELRRRTADAEKLRATSGSQSSRADDEVARLATEQGRLASLALQLGSAASNDASGSTGSRDAQTSQQVRDASPTRAKAPPSHPPSDNRSLAQQLLDDLNGGQQGKLPTGAELPRETLAADHALGKIAASMRQVERRLAARDSSLATQGKQADIVAQLAAILEQSAQPDQTAMPSRSALGTDPPDAGRGQTPSGPPRETTASSKQATPEENQTQDREAALRRAWGHLPDKLREEMQSALSEQFLPKYERVIEEYYRRLND